MLTLHLFSLVQDNPEGCREMDLLAEKADEIERKMSTHTRQKLTINSAFLEVSQNKLNICSNDAGIYLFWIIARLRNIF